MDSDEVADDPSVVAVPGRRRVTHTPALHPSASSQAEHHSDDELAGELEEQVQAVTASLPILAGPVMVGSDGIGEAGTLSDDEMAAIVDDDLSARGALGPIEHLPSLMA